jgi:tetratricopeptide (TPR) repeat protein
MQRSILVGLIVAGLVVGCAPQAAQGPRNIAGPPSDASNTPVTPVAGPGAAGAPSAKTLDDLMAAAAEPSKQDRFSAALMTAMDLLAQKKQVQALAALQAAKQAAKDAGQDADAIQREIDRLQDNQARQAAADATVQNIRSVLDDGRAEEASKLAADALAQYGGSDAADDLLKLKREADALAAAQGDAAARRRKLRDEAKADLDANNLRAAAVALEQAIQPGDDDLKKQLDDVHDRLARYDDNRRRAAELRKDAVNLDDAVAALQEAQKAWDTFEVQQQIAEYQLAMQNRRDRLGVADFEVRGDVGLADAGRTLAEELLPAFKSRFDLVERGQIDKVVQELKLEAGDLNGGQNQAEVGRLAKLRYLVVGSVTPLGGVTVSARLVDVRSGLVVQTARVSAATVQDVLPQLPQLAAVLMMTDEQKLAYEQQLAQQVAAAPTAAPADATPLPPPPDVRPDDQPPPPPVITATPLPPPIGEIKPDDFQALPPPPPPNQAPVVVVEERPDAAVKIRLRHISIDLGDNLFRRGRFREAQAQFELALNAGCDRGEIEVRLDRCRPFLPPAPDVIVIGPPRPRIAILDLAVIGDPDMVPPVLGPWTADSLAPYFWQNYDVVDRDTVCWFMNRLGLSLRDVLTDPVARRWLGRALGVRFFVLGDIRQTASFVVTTHLVDAEFGYDYGWGRVHVRNPFELRLRLGDLVAETLLDPAERQRRREMAEAAEHERDRLAALADEAERLRALQDSQNVPLLVLEAQRIGDGGDLAVSIELLGRARKLRPDGIEVNFLFNLFNERRRRHEWEEERRRDWDAQQAAIVAAQQQQLALAQAAEAAQLAAAQQAVNAQALDLQRQQAFLNLQAQAQLAVQQQQFAQAVQLYQTALALRQSNELYQALADARARADAAAQVALAQAAAARDAALRQQREDELARARLQLVEERHKREAKEQAERAAQAERDNAVFQRLLDAAQTQLAKDQYDAAISSLQSARQLRRTDEVERLLSQALTEQARAAATTAAAQAALEQQLAAEKVRREKAEAEAAHNKELYEAALKLAQEALADKKYDVAEAKFEEAGKVYSTDVIVRGLQQVKDARDAAAADQTAKDAAAKKAGEFQRLRDVGSAALEAKQYDRAVKLLTDANNLKPGDVTVLADLSKAEQLRSEELIKRQHDADKVVRDTSFRQFVEGGKKNLAAKQYDAAASALQEAVRLKPDDKDAAAALAEAQKGQADAARTADQQAQAKKTTEAYQKWMTDGRAALALKQYDAAASAFGEAQKLLPGDAASADFLTQAKKAKADADAAAKDTAKKHQDEQDRIAAVQKSLAQGRAALAAHDLDGATKAFAAAADKAPNDADVKKAQQDLQAALAAANADADARKKRTDQVQALVKKGTDAQAAQKYDEAVQALAEAVRLAPDDAATKDLLAKAQKARTDAQAAVDQAAAKKAADDRAAKVAQLVADARKALAAQDYEGAGKLLADARKLAPDDPAAAKVQDDLAKASKETADRIKKQQADFALAMGAGKSAALKGDYTGAVNSYTEALRIMPGDKDATSALAAAQQAKTAADADAKRKADEAKRKDDFTKLMSQGQAAMTEKHYADAAKAFTDALKIQPDDPTATRALRDANQAAADAARADADKKKREAAYADAMKAGQGAMATKKYTDAAASFTEALRQMPDDKAAAAALKDAKAALDGEAAAKKREADYAAAINAGKAALAAKKYDEAIKAYTDAGKIVPGDKDAAAGLKSAQDAAAADAAAAAADAAKKAAEAKKQADFTNQMNQGQTALSAKKYDDAAKAYQAALQIMPGDAKATTGLQNAQFGQHMTAGQALSAAKKYADAAKEFEAALAIFPDNADAKAALKKAKNNMP